MYAPLRGRRSVGGFTLIELMIVVAIGAILIGTAVPAINGARQRLELDGAMHDVALILQGARLQALSSGRTMRVRFNCPATGQYRVVEVVSDNTIDNAANRCDPTAYPYPDQNAASRPDLDGPIHVLRGGVSFSQSTTVDIAPTGRVTPASGTTPVSISVMKSNATETLSLSASGRISYQ
jgi:prepilin-type N-terminal cleavage/methylation domain-containing protein